MFDLGWSEIVLVGAVALVVIGPKELPGVLRTVGQTIGKARRMASEFQGQFREVLREAEIEEARKALTQGIEEGQYGTSSSSSSMTPEYKPPQIPMPDGSAPASGTPGPGSVEAAAVADPVLPEPPPVPDLTPEQIRAAFTTSPAPAGSGTAGASPSAQGAAGSMTPGVGAAQDTSAAPAVSEPARRVRTRKAPAAAETASVPPETPARKPRKSVNAAAAEASQPDAAPAPATRKPRAKVAAAEPVAAPARPARAKAAKAKPAGEASPLPSVADEPKGNA